MRQKLTYANVMATLAVFIALGGASYAALKLPKNSVGSKQLKKSSVTTAKIKNEAVTGAKVRQGTLTGTQINVSTLGRVPASQSADVADALSAPEAGHQIGAGGEPPFLNGWKRAEAVPVEFFKDHEGIVHLQGSVEPGTSGIMFRLPPGFRPAAGAIARFTSACLGACGGTAEVSVIGPEALSGYDGAVVGPTGSSLVSLYGVTFRAES
jgi:hypothetical protein